jgi:hypothetical protein
LLSRTRTACPWSQGIIATTPSIGFHLVATPSLSAWVCDHNEQDNPRVASWITGGAMEPYVAGADWYPDPAGRYRLRYWDGSRWTDHVATGDGQARDPLDATPLPPPAAVDPTPPPPPVAAPPPAPFPPGPSTAPPAGPPPPPPGPSRRLLFAIGAAVVIVAGVIIAALALRGGGGTTTSSSAPTTQGPTGPLRLPQTIADFQLEPGALDATPDVSVAASYIRSARADGFTLSVIRVPSLNGDRPLHAVIDKAKQDLHPNTPAAIVVSAGTEYTCISGALTSSSGATPATQCVWRVGEFLFSLSGLRLDQQTLLSLAPQVQGATLP